MVAIGSESHVLRAAATDGGSLAYADSAGGGIAIIMPLPHGTTLLGLGEAAGQRIFLNAVGAGRQLIAFDQRGAGASHGAGAPSSWKQRGDDLWAVADAAGVQRAVLYGVFDGGCTIVHAAMRRPDRVLGLILNRTPAHFRATEDDATGASAQQLDAWFGRESATPLGRPLLVMDAIGVGHADAEALVRVWEATETPAALTAQELLLRTVDLRPLLSLITVPALVIAPRRRAQQEGWGEALAKAMPSARLVRPAGGAETLGAIQGFVTVLGSDVGRFASRLPAALARTRRDSQRSVVALRRIVVPVDASVAAARAVELACRLGQPHGAAITLVHVIAVPHTLSLDRPLPKEERSGEQALTLGKVIVSEHGLTVDARQVRDRSVAGGIVRLAREAEANLIVMAIGESVADGTNRISPTALEVLRRSPCEVLLDRE